jgi:hypothetical protein
MALLIEKFLDQPTAGIGVERTGIATGNDDTPN